MKLRSDSRRFAKVISVIFFLTLAIALGSTIWIFLTPRSVLSPEVLQQYHGRDPRLPDWMLLLVIWFGVFVFWVLRRVPHALHFGKSYVEEDKKEVLVGFFECPQCNKVFVREGFCSFCLQHPPELVFREQVWHK